MAAAVDLDQELLRKVHGLNDLELAALLSLTAREHCLISTTHEAVDELTEELRLIASRTFGLSSAVISCHEHTTLDDFANALLPPPPTPPPPASNSSSRRAISPYQTRHHHPHNNGSYFSRTSGGPTSPSSSTSQPPLIANIVLAKHLNRAPRAVQIQALELLRTRRIFTRTTVQTAPKQFLFVAVLGALSGGRAHVVPHLNDFFYLAYWHDPTDGFDYLDRDQGNDADGNDFDDNGDAASTSSSISVVKRRGSSAPLRSIASTQPDGLPLERPLLSEREVALLAQLSRQVRVNVDVARYQMNIISFLRTHRAVGGGITPTATKHFGQLMRSLAPLHGQDFVTPSLVALAAKKVYLHRIKMVAPELERSMQWGSELVAIETILEGREPEDIIDAVLNAVAVPN